MRTQPSMMHWATEKAASIKCYLQLWHRMISGATVKIVRIRHTNIHLTLPSTCFSVQTLHSSFRVQTG
jgi:hypothetical protein